MGKQRGLRGLLGRNGDAEAGLARAEGLARAGGAAALVTDDWSRVAELFGPLRVAPEQLRKFPTEAGSDDEPWDVLLSMLAIDEHTALLKLSERTGLRFVPEPRLQESASRFYEVVPADVARR